MMASSKSWSPPWCGSSSPPRIGISACLLGDEVRFDGGHKRDAFLTEALAPYVDYVRVCPEVEVGMGTPRETLRLVRAGDGGVRMIATGTAIDHTASMTIWAERRVAGLEGDRLAGYVLKKNSPSCGLEAVPVFDARGAVERTGRGLFAEALLRQMPHLPIEEESGLADPRRREHFVERVFAHERLRRCCADGWTRQSLIAFHTAHKMQLLAHSPAQYTELGRMVAEADADVLRDRYRNGFVETLAIPTTRGRHANVLTHMAGHLKHLLSGAGKQELVSSIDRYRLGEVPLEAPIDLVTKQAAAHDVRYLLGQVYLDPYPRELALRRYV